MVLKHISTLFILFSFIITNLSVAEENYLEYRIEGLGAINAKVFINFKNDSAWANNFTQNKFSPCYILLPFNIQDIQQLQIREDLIFTFKILNNKYTLISTFIEKDVKQLDFTVVNPTRPLMTSEGKPKIYIDFRYSDLPESIIDISKSNYFYYIFNIKIYTYRRFDDDAISQNPDIPFIRLNDNEYFLERERIKNNESWFVYPNLQSEIEQKILFVVLMLFGLLTAFFQYFPIKGRNQKFFNIGIIISLLIIALYIILYFSLPSFIFNTIFFFSGPIIPHIIMVIIGYSSLKYSEKYLVKIYGTVMDEGKNSIQSAQISLYYQNSEISDKKPIKELVELNNGNFSFNFIEKKKKKYKIQILKHNYEETIIEHIEVKNKVFESPHPILLKKVS